MDKVLVFIFLVCIIITSNASGAFFDEKLVSKHEELPNFKDEYHIKVTPDPGCEPNCSNATIFWYVEIRSAKKSLHIFLPGNVILKPVSILMVEAEPKAQLKVNWKNLSQKFNGTNWHNTLSIPGFTSSYGLIFNEFCPYQDDDDVVVKDTNELTGHCKYLFGKNLITDFQLLNKSDPIQFIYTANGTTEAYPQFTKTSRIILNITIPKKKIMSGDFKGFSLHPGRGLGFEVTIANISAKKPTRFALIMLPFSKGWVADDEDYQEQTTISDDYDTVFHNLLLAKTKKIPGHRQGTRDSTNTPAFIQWRNFYAASPDGRERRQTHSGRRAILSKGAPKKYMHAIPYLYYGNQFNQKHDGTVLDLVGLRVQPIFFGTSGDGFYEKTNFLKWQGILSMDEPDGKVVDPGLAKLIGIVTSVIVFAIVASVTVSLIVVYRRREGNQRLAAGELDDEVPILNAGDQRRNLNWPPRILLPCGGRLRFWQRLPSPRLSVRETDETEQEETAS